MARRGSQIVVGIGFAQASGVEKVAKEFPNVKFAIVDAVVDLPNVQSIVFKEHEGSFLVGMAAAMASKTGKIGFVGGMDIPLIRKFALGYEEGAKYVNPKIEVFQNMTGTTPAAWNDPDARRELAREPVRPRRRRRVRCRRRHRARRAPGREGQGPAGHRRRLEPELHPPGLDSHLDGQARRRGGLRVVQDREGRHVEAGVRNLGVAEDAVGYSLDQYNRSLHHRRDGKAPPAGAQPISWPARSRSRDYMAK